MPFFRHSLLCGQYWLFRVGRTFWTAAKFREPQNIHRMVKGRPQRPAFFYSVQPLRR